MLNSALPTLFFAFCLFVFCLFVFLSFKCSIIIILYMICVVGTLYGAQRTALWSWFLQVCMVSGCQTQTVRRTQRVLGLLSHLACPHTMLSKLKKFMIVK